MEEITSNTTYSCEPSGTHSSVIARSNCESLNPELEIRNCTATGKWKSGCPKWGEWNDSGLCSQPEYYNGIRDGVQFITRNCLAPDNSVVDNKLCDSLGPEARNISCGEDTSGHINSVYGQSLW